MIFCRWASLLCIVMAIAVLGATPAQSPTKNENLNLDEKTNPEGSGQNAPRSRGLEELASTGWATLKGKVTLEGDLPNLPPLKMNKDSDHCCKGDTRNQTWKIGKDKGVANVVVWLRAPKRKYFKIPEELKDQRNKPVVIDQPYCVFEPHVVVLFPSYYDGKTKKQKTTGQVWKVINSAPIDHNTNMKSDDEDLNSALNKIIAKKADAATTPMKLMPAADKPSSAGGEHFYRIVCDMHTWMKGYARIFDHPYAAVTSGDKLDAKDFGNFEIKDAPAGVELEICYWHESFGDDVKVLGKITLEDKKPTTKDFEVSQP